MAQPLLYSSSRGYGVAELVQELGELVNKALVGAVAADVSQHLLSQDAPLVQLRYLHAGA